MLPRKNKGAFENLNERGAWCDVERIFECSKFTVIDTINVDSWLH